MPWAVGLLSFLALAVAAGVLVGRTSDAEIPQAARDYQEGVTLAAAQSLRRGLNEGVDDLVELSAVLAAAGNTEPSVLAASLRSLVDTHGRYEGAYILGSDGRVLARVGTKPRPDLVGRPTAYGRPTVRDAVNVDGAAVIQELAPLRPATSERLLVVGHYDPLFLRFPLETALPGDAWVVNGRGKVVGALGPNAPFTTLPRATLREAAAKAVAGESGVTVVGGSLDRREVVGYSPVTGIGPAGQLGWGVVTARTVASFDFPQDQVGRQGMLVGIVIAVLALVVFGWLYLVVVRPLLQVQQEAERLAFGDLSKPVQVVRYDEIGLVARALERVRILLIRDRARRRDREG